VLPAQPNELVETFRKAPEKEGNPMEAGGNQKALQISQPEKESARRMPAR